MHLHDLIREGIIVKKEICTTIHRQISINNYKPLGHAMGLEPTTNGTTNHYSNQLSYAYHKLIGIAKVNSFYLLPKYFNQKIENLKQVNQ